MAAKKLSPMMQQYMDIKEAHQDCILFFRLGDFYEMFFEDAKLVSRELELTLTGKNCGLEERAPMCGVPFHSADTYIARLIEKGHKVAICEQTEDPAAAKGLVKREVIRIVTPGTVLSSNMLKEKENNYIASIYAGEDSIGLAYCDVSTGEMNLTTIRGTNQRENLVNEIVKINAREVLVSQETDDKIDTEEMKPVTEAYFNIAADEFYRPDAVRDTIKRQFHVSALLGIGVEEDSPAEFALGSLLLYLLDTQKNSLGHIAFLNTYTLGQHMSLDKATIKNLELTETLFEKKLRGSLLGVLDKTGTAMGSRKLKQWIKEPLNDVTEIALRLDAVEYLTDSVLARNNIREQLKHVYDFERLTGRIACGSANGKDLIALSASCSALPEIKYELSECGSRLLEDLDDEISSLEEVRSQIDAAIVDDPPFTIKEGGLIKEGFSSELDELKHSVQNASYEQKDPLLIYKLESVNLFDAMVNKINNQTISILMRGQIPVQEAPAEAPEAPQAPRQVEVRQAAPEQRQDMSKYREQKVDLNDPNQQAAAAQDTREQPRREPIRAEKTVGRNDPCPCGSGKKYKNCHGRNA